MKTDIVERLRSFNDQVIDGGYHPRIMDEAADEIVRLRKEIEEAKDPLWVYVEGSSNVLGFGYSPGLGILKVRFSGGAEYEYLNVPRDVFDSMKSSESKGSFVSCSLKGKFDFRRV